MKISQNLGQSKHDSSFIKWKIFCYINPQFWPHFMKSPKASWQKKKKRTYGYYYSNTELVNRFKFLWLVRSLELQANISDKLCTLRSQHLTPRQFFIIVEFCLQKVLDLKKYPFVPSSV